MLHITPDGCTGMAPLPECVRDLNANVCAKAKSPLKRAF